MDIPDKRDEMDVLIVLNEKGNCILAGDPESMAKTRKKEMSDYMVRGLTIKTIKFKEFKKLKWYDD